MKIIFHGGAKEVGRSCIELVTRKERLLLDCGLKLTKDDTEYPVGIKDPSGITAVFISHAHLDHTGALPLLDHQGMDCPIYMTRATREITRLLLRDAFKIGKITHHHLGYSSADIKDVMKCIKNVNIDTMGEIGELKYEYFDAGHIPGASSVYIEVDGTTLLYTGDIKTTPTRMHNAAETDFPKVDVMICESTYGDREHPRREAQEMKFIDAIEDTLTRGGTALVPVFAVGRAQEIITLLSKHKFKVPVYLDGMAITATKIALENPQSIRSAPDLKKAFSKVKIVRTEKDRSAALHSQAIIVTTSGMMTGGPVIHYLKELRTNPKHSVLMTGYQAEDTNGRMLLEKGEIYIDGMRRAVKCEVKQFDFSAHSGLSELKKLVRDVRPRMIIWVHGEEASVQNLQEWAEALGMVSHAPEIGDEIET